MILLLSILLPFSTAFFKISWLISRSFAGCLSIILLTITGFAVVILVSPLAIVIIEVVTVYLIYLLYQYLQVAVHNREMDDSKRR